MVAYENPMEVGLYREETGLLCAGGDISVSAPVAQYIHAKFQNEPSTDDTFTSGVEWLYNTDDATWDATDISAISADGLDITIGAGHDDDTFNIGYYAKGYGVGEAAQGVQDDDKWRASHIDNIYSAMSLKGNINPTECGYVYDQVMAYRSMPLIGAAEVEGVYKQEENVVGTWSFENYHPYYVTSIRVEVDESTLQAGKGIKIHAHGADHEILETAGAAGLILNDGAGWYATENDDSVEVWYQANVFLGMMLCDTFQVTVETNGGNTNIPAGSCHVFVSGWHIPDPVDEMEGLISDYSQDYIGTSNLGTYRVEGQAIDSEMKVRFSDQNIALFTDPAMRTHPHFKNDFVNGVEYCKNLTTDKFVTTNIVSMDYRDIHFSPLAVSDGDIVEVGYYSVTEIASRHSMAPGDLMERGILDGMIWGSKRTDRIDLGATNFPYGTGEFEYDYGLFRHVALATTDVTGVDLTTGWRTLLSFDSVSYDSRVMTDKAFGDTRTSYNETPFYATGITVLMDAGAVTAGVQTYDRITLRIAINGSPVKQYGQREVFYLPMANATLYTIAPTPQGTASDAAHDGAGHMLYIPLGMVRCYGLQVDAKVEGTEAFTSVTNRIAYVDGWIPDDGV